MAAQELGEFRCEHHRARRRGLEEGVVEGQLEHLLVRRARHFLAAIADLYAPEAGHRIEDDLTVSVVNVTAVGACNDPAATDVAHQLVVLMSWQVMVDVESTQLGKIALWMGHALAPATD